MGDCVRLFYGVIHEAADSGLDGVVLEERPAGLARHPELVLIRIPASPKGLFRDGLSS